MPKQLDTVQGASRVLWKGLRWLGGHGVLTYDYEQKVDFCQILKWTLHDLQAPPNHRRPSQSTLYASCNVSSCFGMHLGAYGGCECQTMSLVPELA